MQDRNQSQDDADVWISSLDAAHLLSPRVGGDRAAKKAITERLVDGAIEARASWLAHGFDIGRPYVPPVFTFELEDGDPPPRSPSRAEILEQSKPKVSLTRAGSGIAFFVARVDIIGSPFWRSANKEDRKRWDWSEGLFLATHPPGTWADASIPIEQSKMFAMRQYVLGAEFLRAQVEQIAPLSASPKKASVDTPHKSGSRGRKLADGWPDWIAEVVLLQHDGDLFGVSATKLIAIIAKRLGDKEKTCPSETTVRQAAHAIVNAINSEPY